MEEWKETKERLSSELGEISSGLSIASMRLSEQSDGSFRVSAKDADLVERLFGVFKTLRWRLAFDLSKELEVDKDVPILRKNSTIGKAKCGSLVSVRSCRKEHGDRTYVGIFLGEMATTISHSVSGSVVTARPSLHNPAIFVPELGDIVFGYESFWSLMDGDGETSVANVITDETISNTWYIKALRELPEKKMEASDEQV